MLSVFDQGQLPPCPAPFNLAAYVLGHAGDRDDKVALEILGNGDAQGWSFRQLAAAVRGTGTGLLRAGLAPGDIVLMRLGNTVDFPVAYLGAIAAGIVPVPTSPQLTADEIAAMLDDLSPGAVLRDPSVASAPGAPEITLGELRAMRDLPPCDWAMGDPDRLGYIVYTSGTSGQPRAVAHAHRAIWARRMMIRDWYDLRDTDRLMHAGAFNWTYTLGTGLMDPWTVGATALIPAPGTTPDALPGLAAANGATILAAVPGVYRKMLQSAPLPDLPALRHGLSAGEKLSEPLRAAWRTETGTEIYEAFGMSECSTFISSRPHDPAPAGALGTPQRGRRVAILGSDGPVARGDPGTIAVHRSDPGLMLGYLGAPGETAARFAGDWFVTGDQGQMDEAGHVSYLGRADDMMNAGGYRVSPLEVEAALGRFPGLDHVAVTEVEVKADARIIAAFYTAPQSIDADDLHAFAAAHLARYKCPKAYIRVRTLPTNANGKVQRRALPGLFHRDPE